MEATANSYEDMICINSGSHLEERRCHKNCNLLTISGEYQKPLYAKVAKCGDKRSRNLRTSRSMVIPTVVSGDGERVGVLLALVFLL